MSDATDPTRPPGYYDTEWLDEYPTRPPGYSDTEWLDELDRRRALAEIAAMRARVCELEAERAELEDTLEWYASEDRYHYGKGDLDQSEAEMDEGRRARAALEAARGEKNDD